MNNKDPERSEGAQQRGSELRERIMDALRTFFIENKSVNYAGRAGLLADAVLREIAVPAPTDERLKKAIRLLDRALGDTDPAIAPEMTDDEIAQEYPVFAAMQLLTGLSAVPAPVPPVLGADPDNLTDDDLSAFGNALGVANLKVMALKRERERGLVFTRDTLREFLIALRPYGYAFGRPLSAVPSSPSVSLDALRAQIEALRKPRGEGANFEWGWNAALETVVTDVLAAQHAIPEPKESR